MIMAIDPTKVILDQIDALLDAAKVLDSDRATYVELQSWFTRARSCIENFAPKNSTYAFEIDFLNGHGSNSYARATANLQALRDDYANGYFRTLAELIHADVFSDFLDMADYLIEQKYKDPAAVIAGSVLEEHLRKLCDKNGIDVKKPDGSPKKADTLNAELAGASTYSKLDQKNVTAWLDLRNKAAHGKYSEYTKDQVALLIQSVRDFITRNPA